MEKKAITETMYIQNKWYEQAKNMKPEDFQEFFRHLTEDYTHYYGTVCHAMAAIGLAAMWAFNKSEGARGGITGFQAGCVMWLVIKHMNYENNKCGLRLLNMDELLYPQYDYKFHTIDGDTWKAIREEAKNRISQNEAAYKKYLEDMEKYEWDLEQFKSKVKMFEEEHPEYPKYEDNPKFYEHLDCGTSEEWDNELEKEKNGFLFAPRKPYCCTAHPDVLSHWKSIVDGVVPFGLRVRED